MAVDGSLTEEDSIVDMALEPVLVLARLAQISLYPVGSKLYLRNGMIRIHSNDLIQPIIRWMAGDSREDLTYLFDPIRKFTDIYKNKTSDELRFVMKKIVQHAVNGLERLRETYGSHRIVDHSLAYYQTFLIQCADLKVTVSGVKRSPFVHPESAKDMDDIPSLELSDRVLPENKRTTKDASVIGVWSTEDIRMLSNMINEASSAEGNDQIKSRLKTIESFLETKEIQIKNILFSSQRP